jgi:PKD repeat protein
MSRAFRAFTLLVAVAAATACTVKETNPPPLSGPSELGLSLTLQATPDVLLQDGSSQSTLVILARDANGQPARSVTCRLDIGVNGMVADFGRLSTRTVTTGSDGRAVAVYTAPPAPIAVTGDESVVAVLVTPVGTDFANAISRSVSIRLVPPGVVVPPSGATAGFSMAPETVTEMTPVVFNGSMCASDASTNCSRGVVTGWSWNFGDGATANGAVASHTYPSAGTYLVTLTVMDGQGRPASTTRSVAVTALGAPTAAFETSPATPRPLDIVYFNAATSQAAVGRVIVSYEWDFGDGSPHKFGVSVQHDFIANTTYTVTLVVTDDAGRKGTVSKPVKIGS